MIFLILLIYFVNEEDINKFFQFIEHKFKIQKQNIIYREKKEKLKKIYENKKQALRIETEQKMKEIDLKIEEEVKQIENKYKKIMNDLDCIKDRDQIIDFLNKYINMNK